MTPPTVSIVSSVNPQSIVSSVNPQSTISSVTNTHLIDITWLQAALPVKLCGLGVRRAVQVASSIYNLSPSAATADLVSVILPTTHQSLPNPHITINIHRKKELRYVWIMNIASSG